MRDQQVLEEAAAYALKRRDRRNYLMAAIGKRSDGALVRSTNEAVQVPTPSAHAEARLCQKLDIGAEVWIARILRCGKWGLAKPCPRCMTALRKRGVKRVCYSTGPGSYEVLVLG